MPGLFASGLSHLASFAMSALGRETAARAALNAQIADLLQLTRPEASPTWIKAGLRLSKQQASAIDWLPTTFSTAVEAATRGGSGDPCLALEALTDWFGGKNRVLREAIENDKAFYFDIILLGLVGGLPSLTLSSEI